TCYEHLNLPEEGLKWSNEAIAIEERGHETVLHARAYLFQGLGHLLIWRRDGTTADESLRLARRAFQEALQRDEDDHLILFYLALVAAHKRKLSDALALIRRGLQKQSTHISSLHLLCLLLSATGKRDEAMSLILATLREWPGCLPLMYFKAKLQEELVGAEAALGTAREMLSQWKLLYEEQTRADAVDAGGRVVDGVSVAGAAGVDSGLDSVSYNGEAEKDNASITGSLPGGPAASHVEQSLSEVASSVSSYQPRPGPHAVWMMQVNIWLLISELYLSVDQIGNALSALEEAYQILPLSHLVMFTRGLIYERLGDWAGAKQCFQNALAISPTHVRSLRHMGNVYLHLRQPRLAEQTLREALKLDPMDYQVWYSLGQTLDVLGDTTGATEAFATALDLETTSPVVNFSMVPIPFLALLQVKTHSPMRLVVPTVCVLLCILSFGYATPCYVPKSGRDPCAAATCPTGANCVPTSDGLSAKCECPEKCPDYGDSVGSRPVCGSDAREYKNTCELNKRACETKKEITIRYQGACDPCRNFTCEGSTICRLDNNRNPVCACTSRCDQGYTPVCGSDGQTYQNECELKHSSCLKGYEVTVWHPGRCSTFAMNPCRTHECGRHQVCLIDKSGKPFCQCPEVCPSIYAPVCGSDGTTYDSPCHLRRLTCLQNAVVDISHQGVCGTGSDPCVEHKCPFGGVCESRNNRPICNCRPCTNSEGPIVCGSDGKTYKSLCHLKFQACYSRLPITLVREGTCEGGCDVTTCGFGARCEMVDGRALCICPSAVHCPVLGWQTWTSLVVFAIRRPVVKSEEGESIPSLIRFPSSESTTPVLCPFRSPQQIHAFDEQPGELELQAGQTINAHLLSSIQDDGNVQTDNAHESLAPWYGNNSPAPAQLLPFSRLGGQAVCGSDGVTYSNQCELEVSACEKKELIFVANKGPCDQCAGVQCSFSATCVGGRCVCPGRCPQVRDAFVCGSDGVTYQSECHLRASACRAKRNITLTHPGKCLPRPRVTRPPMSELPDCHDTTYGCCLDGKTPAPGLMRAGCPELCQCHALGSRELTCHPHTGQCPCRNGIGGLRCNRCLPGFWGIRQIQFGKDGCAPCACSAFGSDRDDCEQMTGRCVCRRGVTGDKCDQCPFGQELTRSGCQRENRFGLISYRPGSCNGDLRCVGGAVCVSGECVCKRTCVEHEKDSGAVCGSDGVDYPSLCALKMAACELQEDIVLHKFGSCSGYYYS
ncbi:unnamed protein product, partial [Cyprideis torosa]